MFYISDILKNIGGYKMNKTTKFLSKNQIMSIDDMDQAIREAVIKNNDRSLSPINEEEIEKGCFLKSKKTQNNK